MEYDEMPAISREELSVELDSGAPERISRALIRVAFHDADRAWIEDLLVEYLVHANSQVRGVAATCAGHVARIHHGLDLARILPLLEHLLRKPETAGKAQDALDDIEIFITRGEKQDEVP